MPQWDEASLTDQQRRWFASVREGLQRDTGRSLDDWAEIARTCPETMHRARLAWFKANHGLGQNRASLVLSAAFPQEEHAAAAEADPLWADPAAHRVFEAVSAVATSLDGALVGRRKGFTAFSRRYQFAAVRPLKGGAARLALAAPTDADSRLVPHDNSTGSERLKAMIDLASPEAVDEGVASLMRQAWAAS